MGLFNFKVSHYNFKLDWFIFDLQNFQLITSKTIPGDISDQKDIFLTETPIPGLNYAPVQPAGNGNRKISLTIPVINRNNTVGNALILKQFANLRNQGSVITGSNSRKFVPNPKVLYYWGTGSVPLIYFVKKCDFVHKTQWFNQLGKPQYSEIQMELWLDEANPLNKAEDLYRQISSFTQASNFKYVDISGFGGKIV